MSPIDRHAFKTAARHTFRVFVFWLMVAFLAALAFVPILKAIPAGAAIHPNTDPALISPQAAREAKPNCIESHRMFMVMRRPDGTAVIIGAVTIWEPCR